MMCLTSDDLMETFTAVATHGSKAQAAAACGVVRETVTYRLRQLEARMGTRLFDSRRGGRHAVWMRLTPTGEQLLDELLELEEA